MKSLPYKSAFIFAEKCMGASYKGSIPKKKFSQIVEKVHNFLDPPKGVPRKKHKIAYNLPPMHFSAKIKALL